VCQTLKVILFINSLVQENPRKESDWEEKQLEMVKYSYKIVADVFETMDSAELRENCLRNGSLERFIERIGQLTGEHKRKKVDKDSEGESEEEEEEEQIVIDEVKEGSAED
jgi:hypothetical protein